MTLIVKDYRTGVPLGTISLKDGRLSGRTEFAQAFLIDGATPEQAYRALRGWSNGYVVIEEDSYTSKLASLLKRA